MNTKMTFLEAVGAFAALAIAVTVNSFIGAFTSITLYRWFMLPLGAPNLSTGQLYGLLFFVGYVLYRSAPDKPKDERGVTQILAASIGKAIGLAALSLGLGWLLHTIIY